MNFMETIGFIVSLLALIVLSVKKALDDRRRRQFPDEYEEEENEKAERLRAFLKSIDGDMKENIPHPQNAQKHKNALQQKREMVVKNVLPGKPDPGKTDPGKPVYPKPKPSVPFGFKPHVEEHHLDVGVEKRKLKSELDISYNQPSGRLHSDAYNIRHKDAYSLVKSSYHNRALESLSALKSSKDMVILHEVISPPKSLRPL